MFFFNSSIWIEATGVIFALFSVLYAYFKWNFQFWKRKNVPYFEPAIPFGNLQAMIRGMSVEQNVFELVKKARRKGWKYFGIYLSLKPIFIPLDFEMIKTILSKDFNHFSERGLFYNEEDDPISAHLFALGGQKWKTLRSKLTPTFTSGKLKAMFQTLLDCGSNLTQTLEEHNTKEPIDIKHVLVCYSLDVIGSCAFGIDCNSFKEPNSPFVRHGRRVFIRTKFEQLRNQFEESFPKLARILHMKVVPGDVSKFFYDFVSSTVRYREEKNHRRNDFLQILIDMKKNNEHPKASEGNGTNVTMDEIVAQSFLTFMAGFETTSSAVSLLLYELSEDHEVQEKVREELVKVLKKYDNQICYDALNEMEYMQQVVEEVLRRYPPAPFITRGCVQDYKIPGTDVILEKGTSVLVPIKNFHYDESIYEEASKFDPERFSPERKLERHPFSYMPFGEGPRICIGLRFAVMQTKVATSIILSKFRVKLNSKTTTPLEMDPASSVPSVKGGIWLDMEKL